MKIDLTTLETAVTRILAHLHEARGEVIDVPDDLYWFIQHESLVDPTKSPDDITLGSLADDWQQLQRVARAERDPVGYDLVWASAILRCLGEQSP